MINNIKARTAITIIIPTQIPTLNISSINWHPGKRESVRNIKTKRLGVISFFFIRCFAYIMYNFTFLSF